MRGRIPFEEGSARNVEGAASAFCQISTGMLDCPQRGHNPSRVYERKGCCLEGRLLETDFQGEGASAAHGLLPGQARKLDNGSFAEPRFTTL